MTGPNWLTPEAAVRRMENERERHRHGRVVRISQTHPLIGATPTVSLESITGLLTQPRDYGAAFAYSYPTPNYITREEYETMRQEWRLAEWQIYIVMY